jgi:hypothetical protein
VYIVHAYRLRYTEAMVKKSRATPAKKHMTKENFYPNKMGLLVAAVSVAFLVLIAAMTVGRY